MPDWTYQPFFKPILFRLRADSARRLTMGALAFQARTGAGRRVFRWMGHVHPPAAARVEALGLRFSTPIGLAPGIDVDGVALTALQYLGFGFLTVGPVGLEAVARRASNQPLRIPERRAIVWSGETAALSAAEVADRVRRAEHLAVPVAFDLRGADLPGAIRAAEAAASFFTLPPRVAEDDARLAEARAATRKPLLVRLAPDLAPEDLDRALDRILAAGLDGVIATAGLPCPLAEDGELEGPFLRDRALRVVERVIARAGSSLAVIGRGGIESPDDAALFLAAGARLVELGSGLVAAGPGLPKRVLARLLAAPAPGSRSDSVIAAPPGTRDPVERAQKLEAEGHSGAVSDAAPAHLPAPLATGGAFARGSWLLVLLTGLILCGSGLAALVIAATVKLLPYDVAYLGMTVEHLCGKNACRIVHFMAHDRVSWGGSILSVGILYGWLALVPLRRGEAWAWSTLLVSGAVGFASFLTYIGYGYLDVWHGLATLALLVVFVAGMAGSFGTLRRPRGPAALLVPGARAWLWSPAGMGRMALTFTVFGMVTGGLAIMTVGMTTVFVPQDLAYMGTTVAELEALNPRLVPLIAHDRAGFGGGLCSGGLAVLFSLWCGARPGARSLWWALFLSGTIGFASAIGIHPVVGYMNFVHLLPAYVGALSFFIGIRLLHAPLCRPEGGETDAFPDL